MVVEHRITSTDTLRTLAQLYLGDSNRWQTIAEYNGLSYPYIVGSEELRKNLTRGNGHVKIKRTNFRSARTIERGWQVFADIDAFNGQVRTFEVTEATTLPVGVSEVYIHVRALIQGVYGNLPVATTLRAGSGFIENGMSLDECITVDYFTGGQDIRVLSWGEYIYVPNDVNGVTFTDSSRVVAFIGEEDIALDEEGELYIDGFGDIASVQGVQNIVQAINHRCMTERGSLEAHPLYGSNVHYLIGQAQSPYWLKLVELDIYETLSYEDRITGVVVENVQVVGAVVYVTVKFTLRTVAREVQENFVLDYSGAW